MCSVRVCALVGDDRKDVAMTGDEEDFEIHAQHNYVVRTDGSRFDFPDDHTFEVVGPSLVVKDRAGGVVMLFSDQTWAIAVAKGAKFDIVEKDDDEDVEHHHGDGDA
jgi:hypothetical protein